MKNCKVCGNEFKPEAGANTICSEECRDVTKARSKEKWRTKTEDHRKVWARYTQDWREKNPARSKVTAFKTKSKKLGLPFNLDEGFFSSIPEFCPILGIRLDGKTRDSSWSVDRLIPDLGYTKENCVIISMKANRLKQDSSIEDLERLLEYMKKELDKNEKV